MHQGHRQVFVMNDIQACHQLWIENCPTVGNISLAAQQQNIWRPGQSAFKVRHPCSASSSCNVPTKSQLAKELQAWLNHLGRSFDVSTLVHLQNWLEDAWSSPNFCVHLQNTCDFFLQALDKFLPYLKVGHADRSFLYASRRLLLTSSLEHRTLQGAGDRLSCEMIKMQAYMSFHFTASFWNFLKATSSMKRKKSHSTSFNIDGQKFLELLLFNFLCHSRKYMVYHWLTKQLIEWSNNSNDKKCRYWNSLRNCWKAQ